MYFVMCSISLPCAKFIGYTIKQVAIPGIFIVPRLVQISIYLMVKTIRLVQYLFCYVQTVFHLVRYEFAM